MKIYNNVLELIGHTPLVKINKMNDGEADIVVKLEKQNPAGSVKDRPALYMIETAEKAGLIDKDTVIIEPTSGNTGIGLALACAIKGYKMILTMPETMSIERRKLLSAYGAELVLTDGTKGMQGAVDKANELHQEIKNSFIPQQFSNPANPESHVISTAEEIWKDTDGKVDFIVAGMGTGGTISGIAKGLKAKNSNVKAVAVEPASSPLLTKGFAGAHKIQGIGANFVPENYVADLIDEVVAVKDEDAISFAKRLAKEEGILSGISSGAALWTANELSKCPENKGKLIVVILPDSGERYLSSEMFC
ncbi:cysteine synthase A [bacterium]|nr:cysteine synthase A [bacterium]